MQDLELVVAHVEFDEHVETLQGVLVHLHQSAVLQVDLVQIIQSGVDELMASQLSNLIVGQIDDLHFGAHLGGNDGERLVFAVRRFLARYPFAGANTALGFPVGCLGPNASRIVYEQDEQQLKTKTMDEPHPSGG